MLRTHLAVSQRARRSAMVEKLLESSSSATSSGDIEVSPGVFFSRVGHHFYRADTNDVTPDDIDRPLSVIYQVTRRCNFDCDFCSEIEQLPDPSLDDIARIEQNIRGVPRVFLSGGEPLIRRDFVEVVEIFSERVVAVPTNATRGHRLASKLAGKVAFVNIGLEGPRRTTNRVRGDYDQVMRGAMAFLDAGIPLSLSAVVMRSELDALPFAYQIADVLRAGKLKLIHPIRKGNGINLPESEFLDSAESDALFLNLSALQKRFGWTPALRMTTWNNQTEGYSMLVYPDGRTWAWPVFGGVALGGLQAGPVDKVEYLGNLSEEPITEIWKRYRFKGNHLRKYLGRSIKVTSNLLQ
jgi:MoaA/NifB/PqqE/SkfB family radical SAM enzyme